VALHADRAQGGDAGIHLPLIEARHVCKSFRQSGRETVALRDLSFALGRDELAIVSGVSGSGKTTLLCLLGALDVPTSGEVRFDGQNLQELDPERLATLRRRCIGFVFQDFRLIPHLTAVDNVCLPMQLSGRGGRDKARALLDRFGLGDRARHRPGDLSRGEMQRVALARALVHGPDLLIADEPTANLDAANAEVVMALICDLHRERGLTVVLATHDSAILPDARRITLHDGAIVGGER